METANFLDLIKDGNDYGIEKILIPKIQRSYAQGRPDSHAAKIRERFLDSILHALNSDKGLTLDFIYGNIRRNCLVPLDGQQRLTTLWLLHWYAAKKNGIECDCLAKFTYDTRYSARDFMAKLVDFTPAWKKELSSEIRNQGWFPMDWINDPTVSSMLTMLDAIDARFADVDNLWEKLRLIHFHFLSIDEMNLTDDIYIKMNSRGKPLTDFEHFKAEFIKKIKQIADEDTVKRISRKIDIDWTDMLWPYRGDNNIIDDEFLRYFLLICHIVTYRRDRSVSEIAEADFFDLIDNIFCADDGLANLEFMEKAFDCWVDISSSGTTIADFFDGYLSYEHIDGKSLPLDHMDTDILGACLANYPFERQRPNGQQWLTTFYAFLIFLFNKDKIEEHDFRRRLRIVLNLQKNSGSEVVDNPKGDAGNRMPAILAQVERIILQGIVDPAIEINGTNRPNFSVSQLKEENEKLEFTHSNPDLAGDLFELEDHELLNGRIEVIGIGNHHLFSRFISLFNECSYDAVDCALLASGNYSQRKNNWCIMLGSADEDRVGKRAWYTLFHPTENVRGFNETARLLRTLLEEHDTFNDDMLYDIAGQYEQDCELSSRFDWRYYYLHYPEAFRIFRYGKYTQFEDAPYEIVALHSEQKESSKAFQCFLKCIGDNFKWNPRNLDYDGGNLWAGNSAFILFDDNDNEIRRLEIPQNEDGIDTVDRIEYFKNNFK